MFIRRTGTFYPIHVVANSLVVLCVCMSLCGECY